MPLDLPPIFLLPTRLQVDELHRLEERIPSLTYDVGEADIVVGNISRRERARFELRRLGLETDPDPELDPDPEPGGGRHVKVLKLSWLTDCLEQGALLPADAYLLYHGRRVSPRATPRSRPQQAPAAASSAMGGLEQPPPGPALAHQAASEAASEATSEHEGGAPLPPVPGYLGTAYSCQRPTPGNPPNAAFIEELNAIRRLRLLEGDQIGVRAYSTSIATLAAYPHALQRPQEVARLPGCGAKIAELYRQWQGTGRTEETAEAAAEPRMAVLELFYGIWGVGDATARDFYRRGWRDLDDVVEHGWTCLSRVQQIGVKYYDEFQQKMVRHEVEAIADAILSHARQIDAGFEMVIVGGYRRGNEASGDADVVLSHRDEAKTADFIDELVLSLEKSGFVTHTLGLSKRNSQRGQLPLPWKGGGASGRGGTGVDAGFDTLDKAMVVWQDPGKGGAPHRRVDIIVSPWKTVGCALLGWSGGTTFERDLRRYCKRDRGLRFDSSGIRRRADGQWVDLEGSAADARGPPGPGDPRGPRASRGPRAWPRASRGPASDMETAERRVFAGLGLPWRPPEERCTG